MFNIYFWLIILIIIASHFTGLYLDYLNGLMWSDIVPEKLKAIINQDKYALSQKYYRENKRISNIASTINLFAVLLILFLAGFAWVDSLVTTISSNPVIRAVLFFAILGIISDIAHIPFSWYVTFVIEEKYDFNRSTKKLFILDQLKKWMLAGLLGLPILALITWLFGKTGSSFWLYAWLVFTMFSLFMNFFYSNLIVPLFNKQMPLEEGKLRDDIEHLAVKSGFELKNIYTIDGSKRSSRANAYLTGLGRKKRIVLFDTLSDDLSESEIVAVLAHELGHYKKKHNVFILFAGIFQTGLMLYIFSLLSGNIELANALGSREPSFHITLLAFILIYSPVSLVLSLILNKVSRNHEYAADGFAADQGLGDELVSGLKKLSLKNLSNLNPHPAFVFFYYSHPPLLERLKGIQGK